MLRSCFETADTNPNYILSNTNTTGISRLLLSEYLVTVTSPVPKEIVVWEIYIPVHIELNIKTLLIANMKQLLCYEYDIQNKQTTLLLPVAKKLLSPSSLLNVAETWHNRIRRLRRECAQTQSKDLFDPLHENQTKILAFCLRLLLISKPQINCHRFHRYHPPGSTTWMTRVLVSKMLYIRHLLCCWFLLSYETALRWVTPDMDVVIDMSVQKSSDWYALSLHSQKKRAKCACLYSSRCLSYTRNECICCSFV